MNKIIKHYYKINTEKINNMRIILLSDIHYYNKLDAFKLDVIAEHILKLKPDYIAIAGDLLDEAFVQDLDYIYDWIKTLSKISPVIIAIGNHDLLVDEHFKAGFNKKFFQRLENITNVKVLDNKTYIDDNICFNGITLPASYYYELREPEDELVTYINSTFPTMNQKQFNILLCHTPLKIAKKKVLKQLKVCDYLDLVMCGHTHGGITPEFLKPILKHIGIISPLRTFLFPNAYGHRKHGDINIIISSGVTKAGHRNKFHKLDPFFAREITVIDIDKKNKTVGGNV